MKHRGAVPRVALLAGLLAVAAGLALDLPPAATPTAAASLRLVEELPHAATTPVLPGPAWLHDVAPPDTGERAMAFPVEPEREYVLVVDLPGGPGAPDAGPPWVEARASAVAIEGMPRPVVWGAQGDRPLGRFACTPEHGPGPVRCLRTDATRASESTLVATWSPGIRPTRIRLQEASLMDGDAPRSPTLGPLVRRVPVEVSGRTETVRALAAPHGGRYEFDLSGVTGPTLRFGLAFEPGVSAVPMRFRVSVDGLPVFEEESGPGQIPAAYTLPLAEPGGSISRLTLESELAGAAGPARGVWLNPRVERPEKRPHIILFTIDAARADHLSTYGYARDTTPNLSRLATRGVVFERAIAPAANTWQSLVATFWGQYPWELGITNRGRFPPAGTPSLPELLGRQGYETIAGGHSADFPARSLPGFDRVFHLQMPEKGHLPPEAQGRQFADVLATMQRRPVFFWLHVDDPHYALMPRHPQRYNPGYRGRFEREFGTAAELSLPASSLTADEGRQVVALYDAALRDADEILGVLLDGLEQAGLVEDTLVIAAADHGTVLNRQGFPLIHNLPFHEVFRVPLVVSHPGAHLTPGRVQTPVSLVDLLPTILGHVGVADLPRTDGRDLGPLLRGAQLPERPVYSVVFDSIGARYEGPWLSTHAREPSVVQFPEYGRETLIPRDEVFDVSSPAAAGRSLVAQQPALAARLREKLMQERPHWLGGPPPDAGSAIGQDALDALRQAGYLNDRAPSAQ